MLLAQSLREFCSECWSSALIGNCVVYLNSLDARRRFLFLSTQGVTLDVLVA